jgi:hypothetical protein
MPSQPYLYCYNFVDSEWLFAPNDPLELPSGSKVVTIQINKGRREIWVANDETEIFQYSFATGELLDTYECAGCEAADIVIW